ncbi:MAG: glutathione peroxidase [Porticoccaceae bacterium]
MPLLQLAVAAPRGGDGCPNDMSIYRFSCRSMDGELVSLEAFRGQVVLIVNTASKCGFTPQYRGLEMLYQDYRHWGFTVLGFPCDQFLRQEFADDERIERFCVTNYQVSFPLFAKVQVVGHDAEPLFRYLRRTAPGWFGMTGIKWNFTKFLINREGECIRRFATTTYPNRLRQPIESLLT